MTVKITAQMVGELRGRTDAPMMECKKALTEAQGDMVKAEEILRVKLGNKASKAASRITSEGVLACYQDDNAAAMIEVNCETDFVAKNPDFVAFAKTLAQLIAAKNPQDNEALANLDLEGETVETQRKALIGKIGENLTIRRFTRKSAENQKLAHYLHGTKIGVIVEYAGDTPQVGKDIAMHVAAMKPNAVSKEKVDPALVAKERTIAEQKAQESGKPADIVQKMVEGSVQKFLKEVSLTDQMFVKNDKQTVAQMLKEQKSEVFNFTLYVMGEGLEKKEEADFASEVEAQIAAAKKS